MEGTQHNSSGGFASLLQSISFWILVIVTFLVPLFFVPASFISAQFSTSLLFAFGVIVAILLYIISSLLTGSIDLPRPAKYTVLLTAIVPIFYIFAGISNGFSRMSFFGYMFDQSTVGFIILSFLYLFLISLLFRTKHKIFYSYIAFIFSSLLFSIFLLIRIIFGAKVLSFGIFTDLTSTVIGGWNNVGIFFGITALFSLFTHELLNMSRVMKILTLVALIVSLFFLALVNFNAVWIILAFSSFLFILYRFFAVSVHGIDPTNSRSFRHRLKNISLYSVAMFCVAVVFSFYGSTIGSYLSNHFHIVNMEARPSLSLTLEIAKNTLHSRPLFGSGPNTFVTQWLSFKPDDVTATDFWNTDFSSGIGLLPTFAVTTGLLGILSWLLFLGMYLYFGVTSIFSRIEDSLLKYLLVSSFFISLYLWIMAFLYVPSSVIFILTFFFTGLFFASLYAGNVVLIHKYHFFGSPRSSFLSSLIIVAVFAGVCALGYGLYKNSKSLWYFQKSFYALNSVGDLNASEGYMKQAIATVPYDIYYRSLSEIETVKMNNLLASDPKKNKAEDLQKQFNEALSSAITAGVSATQVSPDNYLNWIGLAKVYESASLPDLKIEGAYQSALFSYGEALRRNPKNPQIYLFLARLAAQSGDLNSAQSYALQAINLKRNYIDAYFILSQIEVAGKNIKGAIDSVTSASVLSPSDPAIFFQLGLLKYNISDFRGAIEAFLKSVALSPDYANAKYFLGLSYEAIGQHANAIVQFTDLKKTNPDSKEVSSILSNLLSGKPIFQNSTEVKPEKRATLPVKQTQ